MPDFLVLATSVSPLALVPDLLPILPAIEGVEWQEIGHTSETGVQSAWPEPLLLPGPAPALSICKLLRALGTDITSLELMQIADLVGLNDLFLQLFPFIASMHP